MKATYKDRDQYRHNPGVWQKCCSEILQGFACMCYRSVKKKVNLVFVLEMRNKVGEDYKAGILSWQYTT